MTEVGNVYGQSLYELAKDEGLSREIGEQQTDNAGQIFCACTLAALLTAAADKAGELDAALGE